MDTGLAPMPFRSNESRAIYHRLYIDGALQTLTGWTIELWAAGALLKTITTASNPATAGLIKNQTTNPGEYFFTLLAADVATLLGANASLTVACRVRYVTGQASPPLTFSNVVFPLLLSTP